MPRQPPPRASTVATRKDHRSDASVQREVGFRQCCVCPPCGHYASWADSLPMVRQRQPDVADTIITGLQRDPALCWDCGGHLRAAGFEPRPGRTSLREHDLGILPKMSLSCRRTVGRRRQPCKLSSSTSIPPCGQASQSRRKLCGGPTRALWHQSSIMRDPDIPGPHGAVDGRRLEVIADGLPLFDGANSLWTQRWCLPCTGTGQRSAGLQSEAAHCSRRRDWQPKSVGGGQRRPRILRALAKHRAQGAPDVMRAWLRRFVSLQCCQGFCAVVVGQETSTWGWRGCVLSA